MALISFWKFLAMLITGKLNLLLNLHFESSGDSVMRRFFSNRSDDVFRNQTVALIDFSNALLLWVWFIARNKTLLFHIRTVIIDGDKLSHYFLFVLSRNFIYLCFPSDELDKSQSLINSKLEIYSTKLNKKSNNAVDILSLIEIYSK